MSKVRILPLTILVVGLTLGFKVGDFWPLFLKNGPAIAVPQALAQQAEGEGEEGAALEEDAFQEDAAPPATSAPAGVTNQFGEESQQFSRGEISMLQNLVSRREHLEQREQQLQLRENLIVVAERRVEERIKELKRIEAKIQSLLKQHDDQEEEKLQRLVKMYQTMKPKDAARIFQTLDMVILIEPALPR